MPDLSNDFFSGLVCMTHAISFFTTYEATGSCHHLLLSCCPFWQFTSVMLQEDFFFFCLEKKALVIPHHAHIYPGFILNAQILILSSRWVIRQDLWYGEELLIGPGSSLCPDLLWELRMISPFILQCHENMLKSFLLMNFSDTVFLFLLNKQGNWNTVYLLTLPLLVLLCPFL